MNPHGIMFHHFHGSGHLPGQGSISGDSFWRMLQTIGIRRIVQANEFMERAAAGTLKPTDVCLTFDDNLRCQYDVALPILQDFGLTAFWFIYTGPVDGQYDPLEIYRAFRMQRFESVDAFYGAFDEVLNGLGEAQMIRERLEDFNPAMYLSDFAFYTPADRRFRYIRDEILGPGRYRAVMDWMLHEHGFDVPTQAESLWMNAEMIRQMHDEGHVIGLHSHSHPTRLERMSVDEQRLEYQTNFERIRAITGQAPRAMSHPCNSYNEQTLQILKSLGIEMGFRANMASPTSRGLEWPREDHATIAQRMAA